MYPTLYLSQVLYTRLDPQLINSSETGFVTRIYD